MNWHTVGIIVGIGLVLFAGVCLCGLMLRKCRQQTTFPSRRLTDEEVER